MVSPLTANIYFPAIPAISKAFHKSTELINLTVHNFLHQHDGNSWRKTIGHDVHDFTRRRSVSVPVKADYHYIWRCSLNYTAPMVWGTISDRRGRRPITAICLLILSLSCIGLALTPTSDYWLLMVLRCLQAAGSASTIAIGSILLITQFNAWFSFATGAGVIGDISTREERGGFFGIFTLGPMVHLIHLSKCSAKTSICM